MKLTKEIAIPVVVGLVIGIMLDKYILPNVEDKIDELRQKRSEKTPREDIPETKTETPEDPEPEPEPEPVKEEMPENPVSTKVYRTWSGDKESDMEIKRGCLVIDQDEFDGNPVFDKLTLEYYISDDTLTDDKGEMVTDVRAIVGVTSLYSWWLEHGDPDIIYIRNFGMDTDFEVCRLHESFLGLA